MRYLFILPALVVFAGCGSDRPAAMVHTAGASPAQSPAYVTMPSCPACAECPETPAATPAASAAPAAPVAPASALTIEVNPEHRVMIPCSEAGGCPAPEKKSLDPQTLLAPPATEEVSAAELPPESCPACPSCVVEQSLDMAAPTAIEPMPSATAAEPRATAALPTADRH